MDKDSNIGRSMNFDCLFLLNKKLNQYQEKYLLTLEKSMVSKGCYLNWRNEI